MDSMLNMSQRDLVCDEEMDDDEPEVLTRQDAFVGGKRPHLFEPSQAAWDGEEDMVDGQDALLEQPDLAEYFSQWVIPEKHVVKLCRSYASYLDAKSHAMSK